MKARFVQLVLGFFLLFSCTSSFAQTIEEQRTKTNPAKDQKVSSSKGQQFEIDRKNISYANYAISSGLWIPSRDLAAIGNHPFIGLHLGVRETHVQADWILMVRFGQTPNRYLFPGMTDSTNNFIGGYGGLDIIYYPIVKKRIDIGIIGAIGRESFNEANEGKYKYKSWNFNTGLRLNYFVTKAVYIGVEGRYHFIDMKYDSRNKIKGDALSSNLILGFQKPRKER